MDCIGSGRKRDETRGSDDLVDNRAGRRSSFEVEGKTGGAAGDVSNRGGISAVIIDP